MARLGLMIMVAVRDADSPSVANTAPNFSTKVMLILVYWILGGIPAKRQQGEEKKRRIMRWEWW